MRLRLASVIHGTLALALLSSTSAPLYAQPAKNAAPAKAAEPAPSATPSPAGPATPATTPAEPASPDNLEEAARRYDAGLKLYAEGEFALAVLEFERAYELSPDYRVLYNIGQVRLQLGNYARAKQVLEQYLAEGKDKISAERAAQVQRDLELLATRTARLRIDIPVADAELMVDGAIVGKSPLSEPIILDPGEHRVSARKPGYQGEIVTVTLAGSDEKTIKLSFIKTPDRPRVVIEQRVVQADNSTRKTWMWGTWAAAGVFAAGAVATGGFGMAAANDLDDLRSDPSATRGELDSSQRRARTLLTVSDVLGAAAIVSGGTALYLTLSMPKTEREQPKPGDRKGISLRLAPSAVSLQARY